MCNNLWGFGTRIKPLIPTDDSFYDKIEGTIIIFKKEVPRIENTISFPMSKPKHFARDDSDD